jgi:hypothetical protein
MRVTIRMRHRAVALATWMWAAVATAQVPAGAPPATPAVACRDFCSQLYANDEAQRSRCHEGCEVAARCVDRCDSRFATDDEKRKRCHYRCARAR